MSDLISRRAAIDVLDKIFPTNPMRNDYTQGIACGAALATVYIKQLPSAQSEPTVTGESPVITLDTVFKNEASNINTASYDRAVVGTTIPTVPLEGFAKLSPWGQWIDGENIYGEKFLPDIKYCSVCYKEAYWDSERGQQLFPYCPNCGARMEEDDGTD